MNEMRATQRRNDRIAPIYDQMEGLVEAVFYREWRQMIWSRLEAGRILEIGTGTGKNTRFYPEGAEIHAMDVSQNMLTKAPRGHQRSAVTVQRYQMDAQALAFPEGSFDAAIATFVFCLVPDPIRGLREASRAVKPGGKLLLLEHTRAASEWMGRLMDWLDPITVRLMGPLLNRLTEVNLDFAGWRNLNIKELDSLSIFLLLEATKPVNL